MKFKEAISKIFAYEENNNYQYKLSQTQISNNINEDLINEQNKKLSTSLKSNQEYITVKYNALINSDIVLRNLNINIKGKLYSALLFYIDGMVESDLINNYVLKALMMKNDNNMFSEKESIITTPPKNITSNIENAKDIENNNTRYRQANHIEISDYIYNSLIPQNSITTVSDFTNLFSSVNAGFTALLIDSIDTAFCIEAKGFAARSVDKPSNEVVVRGSQEAFIENIRTNTSLLRRLINNENLVIEQLSVGNISKTPVCICYMQNITNDDLVNEVRFRISNLNIDSLLSSDTLDQLIQDSTSSPFPQLMATERPDRASTSILEGRVVILVNGTPYALIAPAVFVDFLSSPEDLNQKYQFANLIKIIRTIAFTVSLFLPGIYVAVTNFHQELIPTDLIFAIAAGRKAIPFPVIFEILLMELSFELIREASLRIPSPMGSTIGIIGGLILGEAAVSANIVSPILIIIVALTGICSFAIPDYSLGFCLRIFRFMYIILAYIAGFLGMGLGIFLQLIFLNNIKSFGVSYFSPYIPAGNKNTTNTLFARPIWQIEKRSNFLNTKKPITEAKISMEWKKQ